MVMTLLPDNPSFVVYEVKRPFLNTFSPPPSVAIHKFPSLSSQNALTMLLDRPSRVVKEENLPSLKLFSPSLVPIQRLFSLSTYSARMTLFFISGVLLRSNIVKLTPSKRANPSSVPSHKYPSAVCTTAVTVFCGKPSSDVHEWTMYWLMVFCGSSANAG